MSQPNLMIRSKLIFSTIILLCLPFLFFFFLIPFISNLTLGNDYPRFPIPEQMELMFSLKTGSFPLYVPGFCGGQSSSALTLGQLYHPISHIASILPGYWEGNALEWNTMIRLVSLGVAHIGLFFFLLNLGVDSVLAFILSFITVYNLRMLDLFRYGASLESWTGHLFLCTAIGIYCIKKNKLFGGLSITTSTYWLVTSGHPQMMYYGLIGAGLFAILVPYVVKTLIAERYLTRREILYFYFFVGAFITTGILISSAYIFPFYNDFLISNSGRFNSTYEWSNAFADSFLGTINNFFFPLRSDVSNAFGGSFLYLIAVLAPFLRWFKVKLPAIIWIIWSLILFVFLCMQGDRTIIHYVVWKCMPFFSSFRIAGRISMILPILLLLMLTWCLKAKGYDFKIFNRNFHVTPSIYLILMAIVLMGIYTLFVSKIIHENSIYSALSIRSIPISIEKIIQVLGVISLFVFSCYIIFQNHRQIFSHLSICFIVLHVASLLYWGTWVEEKFPTPTYDQLIDFKKRNLSFMHLPGTGMTSKTVMNHITLSSWDTFLGKVYREWISVQNNVEAYKKIMNGIRSDLVILESSLPDKIQASIKMQSNDRVSLEYSSFNRLIFNVTAAEDSIFKLSYPYSDHWKAYLNTKETPVIRANGAYLAVLIPAGVNSIEFKYYSPAAFLGMMISCATLTISILISFLHMRGAILKLSVLTTISIPICIFMLWQHSLFNGKNIGTIYKWESPSSPLNQNIAFGRKSRASSLMVYTFAGIVYYCDFDVYSSFGRSVDGNRELNSGFLTQKQENPWWYIDFITPTEMGSVVLYGNFSEDILNTQRLLVIFTDDLQNRKHVEEINVTPNERPLVLKLNKSVLARFVIIEGQGECRLSIDEVEIYPPE
ncbi:MAG: YfhO family protein [Desulfobacterales bacterium]|nr:YfhO family protein [Desulfobacterales bacterium]